MDDFTRTAVMKEAIKLFENGYRVEQIAKIVAVLYPESEGIPNAVRKGIEIYVSLCKAVDAAGGRGWSGDTLCEMTAMDLLSRLATNHVRFVFQREKPS